MYAGVRIVSEAKEMSLAEFHEANDKQLPEGTDGDVVGMMVTYSDGSNAWFTTEDFNNSFAPITKKVAEGMMKSESLSDDLNLIGEIRSNVEKITNNEWSLKEFAKQTLKACGVDTFA